MVRLSGAQLQAASCVGAFVPAIDRGRSSRRRLHRHRPLPARESDRTVRNLDPFKHRRRFRKGICAGVRPVPRDRPRIGLRARHPDPTGSRLASDQQQRCDSVHRRNRRDPENAATPQNQHSAMTTPPGSGLVSSVSCLDERIRRVRDEPREEDRAFGSVDSLAGEREDSSDCGGGDHDRNGEERDLGESTRTQNGSEPDDAK